MTDWQRRFQFDLWYLFGRPRWDTGIVPPEVVEFVNGHAPGRALDIGCGTGTNILFLAKSGWQVDGIDFSHQAIRIAKSRLRNAHLQANLWVDDATRLTKPQGVYNYILDIGCFHQLAAVQKQSYILAVKQHVAPGSILMIYGHCHAPGVNRYHGLSEMDISALAEEFTLVRRVDGQEAQRGASAWLWLEK